MPTYIVRSIVIALDYHQPRYHKDDKPNFDGTPVSVKNEIVYWHKSNKGYIQCFKDKEEAQSLIDILIIKEDIFTTDGFDILNCNDPAIRYGTLVLDYEILFPEFAVLPARNFYTLPFKIIGKRAHID